MQELLIPSLASFILGVVGYIMVRMWFIPIWRYAKIKRHLAGQLQRYAETVERSAEVHRREGERGRLTLSLRRQADAMVTCYQYELPYWYRLMIASRGETPVEAAKPLMGLSNIKDAEHARRRIAEIREQLRLS
jgi:hypothetical protein